MEDMINTRGSAIQARMRSIACVLFCISILGFRYNLILVGIRQIRRITAREVYIVNNYNLHKSLLTVINAPFQCS